MTHVPRAPMHPSEVPQQRVYLLKDMPERPDGFRGSCIYYEGEPEGLTEPEFADNPTLIGGVEWAWSPIHSRLDNYYIERHGKWWLLWNAFEDDNTWNWEVVWTLYGAAKSEVASEYEAAIYTLMDAWAGDEVDHFHWINHEGLLSVGDMNEIARAVWPEDRGDS